MIVCVSPQYKESVNCRSEAQYCKIWKKSHGLQLLYVMMDNEYTTVSKAQTVDGWLGFMVGTELWYPLWSPGNVQSTAVELAKLIGDNARSNGMSTIVPTSPSKTMVASASSPTVIVVSSPTPTSGPPVVDYAKAWSVITDARRVVADKFDELTAFLQGNHPCLILPKIRNPNLALTNYTKFIKYIYQNKESRKVVIWRYKMRRS